MLGRVGADGTTVAAGGVDRDGASSETRGFRLAQSPRKQRKEPSAAELVRVPETPDNALLRVRRTPRVFVSSGECGARMRNRRDLRVNLLPSILRDTEECSSSPKQVTAAEAAAGLEAEMGSFLKLYKSIVDKREQEMTAFKVFYPREPPELDESFEPERVIARTCRTLGDLVRRRVERFRRPVENLLALCSTVPTSSLGVEQDLEELSNILTLDMERREVAYKGTAKTPGFMSIQVASRVPLTAIDPLQPESASGRRRVEAERLAGCDSYVLRMDFQPGEVRQLSFGLTDARFRRTALATRLASLVAPEHGTLANILKILQDATKSTDGCVCILTDVLREIETELPTAAPPALEAAGSEAAKQERLKELSEGPKRTLSRLLEAVDSLATVISPVIPSLARFVDHLGLICVREVDRVINRSHENFESLLGEWAKVEKERQHLRNVCAAAGLSRAEVSVESSASQSSKRLFRLETDLLSQEQAHIALLRENRRLEEQLEASQREIRMLRAREETGSIYAKLSRVGTQTTMADKDMSPRDTSPAQSVSPSRRISEAPQGRKISTISTHSIAGSMAAPLMSPRAGGRMKATVPTFSVNRSTQTDTEIYFSQKAVLPEEMTFGEYGTVIETTGRLYGMLRRYEWNHAIARFLPTSQEAKVNLDETPVLPAGDKPQKVKAAHTRVVNLHVMREKIEQAYQKASISQLEEEISRLQAIARDGFDVWIRSTVKEEAPKKELPSRVVDPDELWATCLEIVNVEGMRCRVRQLEDHLQSLLPLSEVVKTGDRGGNNAGATDSAFWRRVLRAMQDTGGTLLSKASRKSKKVSIGTDSAQAPQLLPGPLLHELAAIWASLGRFDGSQETMTRKPTQQVLQNAMKTFYLRKTGRSKDVEMAVIRLCRAVMDNCTASPKVLLFAVMCGLENPRAFGDKLPQPQPSILQLANTAATPDRLKDLPLDAAHAIAHLMRELKKRRNRRFGQWEGGGSKESRDINGSTQGEKTHGKEEEDEGTGDLALSVQLLLAAARDALYHRSRATARFFECSLFAFTEFFVEAPPSLAREATEDNVGSSQGPPLRMDELQQKYEVLYLSHLLKAYLAELAQHPEMQPHWASTAVSALGLATQEDREVALLDALWNHLLVSSAAGDLRVTLGLAPPTSVPASKLADLLVQEGIVFMPTAFVAAAIVASTGAGRQDPLSIEITQIDFDRLGSNWSMQGGEQSAVCRESLTLWAAIWALALERSHELDLLGRIFVSFDDSGDGWLQYSEFAALFAIIFPSVTKAETEDLFLFGAEENTGDMTREVFVSLVLRLGMTSDLDGLEDVLASRQGNRRLSGV